MELHEVMGDAHAAAAAAAADAARRRRAARPHATSAVIVSLTTGCWSSARTS
ncbi:Uncharacterised protein [Burkholderia pseudomallei]|uniref:Uncharacterized protein n=1 Tax=Burkholderia pseudomallei TaxID=28450 RepID=A0AA40JFQ5_BURPE|nr:hypothetical protein BG16_5022 [Burkholderia pseudomallei MSHR2543]KGV96267.1 hypothetical protein X897_3675 [Burkholderia pseudomallei ABCPW 30]KGW41614.1 hypothetical protein Y597_2924 [Burkholderia pseudomallei MSHR1000]KGW82404.1 hypothetical protein Y030_540 [Burkholderia pseudomallei MSHR332]KGX11101.1 hypothetical protein Y036_3981 [Burkholderia pseudomallei]KGX35172.1 hypothetical protein Y043_2134 [Burkholderia pseudomallei MSHR2138]KGX60445.1 hypothetical protein Y024_3538 [Burkh